MAICCIQDSWVFTFGIIGNIVSFMVYLAPAPTFYRIIKRKSTEGFQSFPYLVALFSSMLWIYYASLKPNAYLLISINAVGCVVETIYIALYIAYAPKKARMLTVSFLLLFNFGVFSVVVLSSHFIAKGTFRLQLLGWICLAVSASVFAAPLSIIRQVIRTKSVEFMPFTLSFFLTLNAITWFFYGLLLKDLYVTVPNVLGFVFGVLQMVLYLIYKNCNRVPEEEQQKLPSTVKLETIIISVDRVHSVPDHFGEDEQGNDLNKHGKTSCDEEIGMDASNQV
ncbi:bidirectional sugar transporter N3-like [Rhododendron vialii]|uniref:bidirectional sugar transporter N3-like n=1 Tax=Rhododendron vialii TaxID=182163 RepID=UPI00265F33B1|nr:bidirectional sugar transporter N3-like [Rhododendron vialii]